MDSDLQIQKELLSPPGDTIQETIDAMGMSQAELAERIGRPKEKLNGLIKGNEPLTLRTAVLLERVLGIPLEFWMEREREYRIELSKIEQKEFLNGCVDWLKKFPVAELKKMGWLPNTVNQIELVNAILRFFGVATPVEWENIYLSEAVSASFKISLANTKSPHAISAWIRIGELKSKQNKLPEFEKSAFMNSLQEIKMLVAKQPNDFKEQLQEKCGKCGVAVLYTPCLSKAPIAGATWWKNNNPIIQLTGRYKTNDSFWFAFYHEAAHILKHGKKEIFLEDLQGTPMDKEKEKEADEYAQKQLFPENALSMLKNMQLLTNEVILTFAAKYGTHPAVIVGQLQHSGIISHTSFNHFKVSVAIDNN
jgi:plasmid maintenance system antidote protein VapI/Zn-dependent peptidase ImmA (M78 family)